MIRRKKNPDRNIRNHQITRGGIVPLVELPEMPLGNLPIFPSVRLRRVDIVHDDDVV